ncbi:MAG: putative zinc-binding protein [Sedimentisphaerales bacterium]|nr:putative zinc-binding protein [Sedimentisphaerales bacterium]
MSNENICSGGPKLIFACSGAADVGEISDRAARKLSKDGVGAMFCLAGIGGEVEPILKKTHSASKILAIDGCSLNCVKSTLEQAGFEEFEYIRVTDLGLEKGKSPASEENIAKVTAAAAEKLS